MKKLFVFAALVIFAGFSSNVFAQLTASSTASAAVVSATSTTKIADLNFGLMVKPVAAATVIVNPATSLRTVGAGGTITLLTSGTPFSVGTFSANGDANKTYAVTFGATSIQLTSGANNMTVDNFTTDGIAPTNAAGSDVFNVGATLNVGAGQAIGNYTGTYDVTVAFL